MSLIGLVVDHMNLMQILMVGVPIIVIGLLLQSLKFDPSPGRNAKMRELLEKNKP